LILRTPLALIVLALVLALAGCGSSGQTSADEPLIPRGLASDLAAKSEAIAAALEAGDVCGAAQLADELKDAVDAAVSGGQVPPELQGELEQTAVELQNDVNCPEPEEEDEDGNEGKGKGKGKGHDDETTTLGTTVPTTGDED
jgi:hypothetical protein